MHTEFVFLTVLIAVGTWGALMLAVEAGWRLGRQQHANAAKEPATTGIGGVDGAVYSLAALLLGFSFSGAASRYDQRRRLIADEVVAVTTALQRVELVSPEQAATLRSLTGDYVRAVLHDIDHPDSTSMFRESAGTARAREQLWTTAIAIGSTPTGEPVRGIILPALNDVFTAVQRERLARRDRPPASIPAMLILTTLVAALFAGYGLARTPQRNWLYVVGFTGTLALAIYMIVELEFPWLGTIQMTFITEALRDVVSGVQ